VVDPDPEQDQQRRVAEQLAQLLGVEVRTVR